MENQPMNATATPGQRRVRLTVAGRVQGVFFRARTRDQARRLELAGWVRNLPDGRVEILAEGDASQVARLVEWARSGPALARVDTLDSQDEIPAGEPTGFHIR